MPAELAEKMRWLRLGLHACPLPSPLQKKPPPAIGRSAAVGLAAGDGKAVQHRGPGDGRGCAVCADDVIGVGAVDVGGVRHHAVGIRVVVAADVAAEHRDVGHRVALGARVSLPAKPP